MGVAYFIVPERKLPQRDVFVDGKSLAHVPQKTLDRLCSKLGVTPLLGFFSMSAEDAIDQFGDFGVELSEAPSEQWFNASEGLKTVQALLRHLEKNPKTIRNAANVIMDLQEYEKVLKRLKKRRIRWHLAIDI